MSNIHIIIPVNFTEKVMNIYNQNAVWNDKKCFHIDGKLFHFH